MLKNFVKLFPLRGPLRPAQDDAAQWRSHKACTEPAEVKTVEQYGDLVGQVSGLEAEYDVGEGGRIWMGKNLWSWAIPALCLNEPMNLLPLISCQVRPW